MNLISKEGVNIKADVRFANISLHLKNMFENREEGLTEEVHLPVISADMIKVILEYCDHYNYQREPAIPHPLPSNNLRDVVDAWEADFIGRFDIEGILELLKAVNFLDIPCIFELCCAAVAVNFRGKSFD